MIQMSVQRGNYDFMMVMLNVGEFLRQQPLMVVVNQGDGADNQRVRCYHRRPDQTIANQVAKGLRTGLVPLIGNIRIKPA